MIIMNAIEFTTELTNSSVVNIPKNIALQMSESSSVQVIVLTDESGDAKWQLGAYEQSLHDDSEEDAIYESLRRYVRRNHHLQIQFTADRDNKQQLQRFHIHNVTKKTISNSESCY